MHQRDLGSSKGWRSILLAVPPWVRPYVRCCALAMVVLAGDTLTGMLIESGWTMGLGTVVAVRLLTALPMLHYPLAGFLLSIEADKWDWFWLGAGNRDEAFQALYQQWDKALDLVSLGVAALVAHRWPDRIMRGVTLAAFALRAIGVGAFVATQQGWLLVAFPNVFESLFLMYLIFHLISGRDQMVRGVGATVVVVLAALLPKLAEEYFLHVMDRRPFDWPLLARTEEPVLVMLLYLPPLVVVVVLAHWSRGRIADGDREVQLRAV